MRIVYLHQYFNTPSMAGGTRSYEFARRLVERGHSVEMVTTNRNARVGRAWTESLEAGIKVHWLPVNYANSMGYAERMRAFAKFAIRAATKTASLSADVIYATSTPLTIAIPAVYSSRRLGCPMVFEVRDLWPDLPVAVGAIRNPMLIRAARHLEKFAYRNARRVVALSPGMADGVERAGYPRELISIIPNSCDLDLFARSNVKGQAFRSQNGICESALLVGYVGTLGLINDVEFLVRTAAYLKGDKKIHFLIVGAGSESQRLRNLAQDMGVLGTNLTMLEQVSKQNVPDILSACDIACSLFLPIPEMEANSANKFFDALAAGCCLAINYGGWQAEIIKETGCGLCLDRDPRVAARTLQRLADNPEKVRQSGAIASKVAKERFSRDMLADQLERVLEDAVGDK